MPTLLLVIALLAIPTLDATSGTLTHSIIGPGDAPNTFRLRIDITLDTEGQCPDHQCAWCCGGIRATISPEPVYYPGAFITPVEGGVETYAEVSHPDGGWVYMDLDVSETYTFRDISGDAHWMDTEPVFPFNCSTSDICTRIDDGYTDFEVAGPAVATEGERWSALKSRY